MKTKSFLACCVLFLTLVHARADTIFNNNASFYDACKVTVVALDKKEWTQEELKKRDQIIAFFTGIIIADRMNDINVQHLPYRLPEQDVTPRLLLAVVIKYMDAHPEAFSKELAYIVNNAFKDAYPTK